MVSPELSREAARLFNKYKVPIDPGIKWAFELQAAESETDLSPELKKFLANPYFINPKPASISESENEE
jgi:hypothetical protein